MFLVFTVVEVAWLWGGLKAYGMLTARVFEELSTEILY